ncbi:MAG: anti-sigma factor [Thermoanaerobaculia bacterium]
MTEPKDEPKDREERAILEALALLDAEDPLEGLAREDAAQEEAGRRDEARDVLQRLYVETLGLIALSEEPVAPADGAKERLMSAVSASRTAQGEGAARPAEVVAFGSRGGQQGEAPRDGRASGTGGPEAAPGTRRRPWLAAMAAGLLAAALGLSGWLAVELQQTRVALERLQQEHVRLADRLDRQDELVQRVGSSANLLSVVSRPGVELCPLRPVGDQPPVPGAFAVVYMPPDSEEWYLAASNMEAARGGVYAVWFNTAEGPVPVGILQGGPDASLQFVPPRLEDHGGMVSIAVTLEPAPGVEEPSGPVVLYGDDRVSVS